MLVLAAQMVMFSSMLLSQLPVFGSLMPV